MGKRNEKDIENEKTTKELEGLLGFGKFSAHKSYYPELKKKIDELEKEKDRYKRIFTDALYGIIQFDEDGKIIICNPALALTCGYDSPDDIQAFKDAREELFLHSEDAQKFFHIMDQNGSVESWGTCFRYRDGSCVEVALTASWMKGEHSRVIECLVQDVSDTRKAERALREEESKLRTTLDSIGDAVIATDIEGRVVRMNPIAETLTGWTMDDALGREVKEVFNIVNSRTRNAAENPIEKAMHSGRIVGLANDTLLISRDGKEYQIADSASPIHDDNGEISGIVMVFRDVSEEYRIRRKLEENETFLSELFNSILDGVSVLDKDLNVLRVNNVMNEWFKDKLPLEGNKCNQNLHDFNQPCENCPTRKCLSTGQTERSIVRGKPGTELEWLELHSYPIRDRASGEIKGVAEFVRNITHQKRTETELTRVFNMSLDMICVVDISTTHYLKVNPAFTRVLGYTEDELIDKPFLSFVHPDDVEETRRITGEILTQGREVIDFQNRYRCKDGSYRVLQWVSHPDLSINVAYASARDVTDDIERKRALEISEAKFRSVVECSPFGIHMYRLDSEGILRFESANPAADKITGIEHSKLKGLPVVDAFQTAKINEIVNKYTSIITEGDLYASDEFTYNYNLAESTYSINAFRTGPDEMVALFQDVTEKNKAEAALRESEDRFRSITEQINEMIYLTSERGIIKYVSPSAMTIFRLKPEEMIGQPFMRFLHDDYIDSAIAAFSESMQTGKSADDLQLKMKRGDGTYFMGELTGKLYQHGDSTGSIGVIRDISDRKKSEQALRESEELFRTLHMNLPGGMVLIDRDYHIIDVNRRTCEITGYKREELVGQLCDIICPKGSISKKCPIWAEDRTGFEGMDTFIKCKDQSFNPILKNAKRVVVNGKEHILEVFQDIREQKETEGALRDSEARMRSIFRAAPVGIGISSGRIIQTVNDRFEEITGYTRGEIVGKNTRFLYPSEEEYQQTYRKGVELIRQFGIGTVETRYLKKDKSIVDVLLGIAPLNPDDLSMGETFTIMDITDRKRAEAELRLQALVLSQIRDCVTVTDLDGIITYVNEAEARQLGVPRDEFIGREVSEYGDNAHQGATQQEIYDDTLKNGSWEGIVVNYRADGKELIMDTRTQIVYDETGKKIALCGIATDITERKQLEKERERLQEQYYQAMKLESIGRLAGGVAHDLNNLLTPVLGYGELLMLENLQSEMNRESVRQIVNAATRARDLVSQLLAFSRKQTLRFELVDINNLVKRFEQLLRMSIREDITMNIQLGQQQLVIEGDIGQLEQVIMNLAVNAQDAMPDGGHLIITTDRVYLDDTYITNHEPIKTGFYVMLSVRDTGHGMDEETLKQIFEPFFTTKSKHKGTGLGLATVYGIVKQHGGCIYASSVLEEGTTFKVCLPVAKEALETMQEETANASHSLGGVETILLVEDDEQVLKLAESILLHHGYKVISAESGKIAIEKLIEMNGEIDLLLSDVVMPEMNGRQVYEKALEIKPDIRVLFMSGYTDDVIAKRGVLDSGLHYIQKPFTVQSLSARVRETLDE